ncbi:phosphoribosylanthranilate isomerase [Vannielia litorea]|uniref:N-(5'-phosphoribosyl)anthranilate isomerase n=1 Tax=Vannielia litorea TaxID=1217970 RepID=A0A1N6GL44_9RHOB|nr:phosphoribosylanthranilate isomerase [Vannielia litorea]SIO08217.1 phosphoribosylanthranilate isomerase [Vannielia litorea]
MQDIRVKICGLKRPEDMRALAQAGAAYAGLNFFEPSPRYVTPALARELALLAPEGLAKVGLLVDPSDALLDEIVEAVPLDIIQLHGRESPERVEEVRGRYGLPVMKAVGVATEADLPLLDDHGRVADMLLVDAKPAPGDELPGGNGLPFDWRLIAGRRWPVPWMLAGGLHAGNVAEAVERTGARQVDLSSGVEREKGVKDAGLIRAFMEAVAGVTA